MCIAVFKPNGVAFPPKEIFESCFLSNKDGSGFAWYNTKLNRYIIKKGFMTFDEFWEAYTKEVIPQETHAIFHFRIATSGGVNKENTHPFPISNDYNRLKATSIRSKTAVAHNGVLFSTNMPEGISDTQYFIKNVLADAPVYHFIMSKSITWLVNNSIGSSKLVICKEGRHVLLGKWEEDEGIFYSNSTYKTPRYSRSGFYNGLGNRYWNDFSNTTYPDYFTWKWTCPVCNKGRNQKSEHVSAEAVQLFCYDCKSWIPKKDIKDCDVTKNEKEKRDWCCGKCGFAVVGVMSTYGINEGKVWCNRCQNWEIPKEKEENYIKRCIECNNQMASYAGTYEENGKIKSWCSTCRKYVETKKVLLLEDNKNKHTCPKCKSDLEYISTIDKYWCNNCRTHTLTGKEVKEKKREVENLFPYPFQYLCPSCKNSLFPKVTSQEIHNDEELVFSCPSCNTNYAKSAINELEINTDVNEEENGLYCPFCFTIHSVVNKKREQEMSKSKELYFCNECKEYFSGINFLLEEDVEDGWLFYLRGNDAFLDEKKEEKFDLEKDEGVKEIPTICPYCYQEVVLTKEGIKKNKNNNWSCPYCKEVFLYDKEKHTSMVI